MRKLIVAGVVAVAPVWAALAGDSWEPGYQQGVTPLESAVRMKAVTALDPSSARAREYLYGVLDSETWYVRGGAIERLSAATGDALEDLKKQVTRSKSAFVREGIVYALGRSRQNVNLTIPALDDKDPIVRRAAAISLGRAPTREGIDALIATLGREKEHEVKVFEREALEKSTGQFLGYVALDWKNWWEANKAAWKSRDEKADAGKHEKTEDEKKAEEAGNKAAESTLPMTEVELTFSEAGRGGPLFVMPQMWRNRLYMEKSLSALEDVAHVYYIDLPEIFKFKGLKNYAGSGVPFYPLDKLADAFEELRVERKQERIAILGHGLTAWVAMRYAKKYPDHVSHLILVSAWTSNKMWEKGRETIERDGHGAKQPEQEHCAINMVVDEKGKPNYLPKDPQEQEALDRMRWTLQFADARNSYANLWYRDSWREMGGFIIPEFDVGKDMGPGNMVPTLVIAGTHKRSLWTSVEDLKLFQKYFPSAEVVQCPNSACMPMLEDPQLFQQSMRAFFKKYPFAKARK